MSQVSATTFRNRSAIELRNDLVSMTILPGGGHIAAFTLHGHGLNPLWEPNWPGLEPNLRALGDPDVYGDSEESVLLSSIAGHNLCLDTFGAHSAGESGAGLSFHGEAGMTQWEVESFEEGEQGQLVLAAFLRHSKLVVRRTYTLRRGSTSVVVREAVTNEIGVERALGATQHASLGGAFLGTPDNPARFAANADFGRTWVMAPTQFDYAFENDAEFGYPHIPDRSGGTQDWRKFPRQDPSSDLCTMRIRPQDDYGWFCAVQPSCELAVAYAWERAAFPWLMTWEECHGRTQKPWNGLEVARGLEFGSYAFATSRRENVNRSTMFDTPTFSWLDAYETRSTQFVVALTPVDRALANAPLVRLNDWQVELEDV